MGIDLAPSLQMQAMPLTASTTVTRSASSLTLAPDAAPQQGTSLITAFNPSGGASKVPAQPTPDPSPLRPALVEEEMIAPEEVAQTFLEVPIPPQITLKRKVPWLWIGAGAAALGVVGWLALRR
jgi:hypothetical protein